MQRRTHPPPSFGTFSVPVARALHRGEFQTENGRDRSEVENVRAVTTVPHRASRSENHQTEGVSVSCQSIVWKCMMWSRPFRA